MAAHTASSSVRHWVPGSARATPTTVCAEPGARTTGVHGAGLWGRTAGAALATGRGADLGNGLITAPITAPEVGHSGPSPRIPHRRRDPPTVDPCARTSP